MLELELADVHTYYGESHILNGVSLKVEKGSVVALLGRNGMGKTTTLRSIVGFTPPRHGSIRFRGEEITHLQPHKIAKMGMALVPQGRRIFASLSVKENLTVAARSSGKEDAWSLDRIYSLFPILKERANLRSNLLSGGEQQMLSIARALMTNPDLLLMDEASEGLSPLFVRELSKIIVGLHQSNISILLVEQNLALALATAGYAYILNRGTIVYECTVEDLRNDREAQAKFIGVSVTESNESHVNGKSKE